MEGENQESENNTNEKSLSSNNDNPDTEFSNIREIDEPSKSEDLKQDGKDVRKPEREETISAQTEMSIDKTETEVPLKTPNSLSIIRTYGDDESDVEDDKTDDKIEPKNDNFSKVQSSSSSDSSDESSSDDETSCDNSDAEAVSQIPLRRAKALKFNKDPLELDNLPPIENLQITVKEEECVPMGKVFSIVDRLLVIESFADSPALMLDTVLFNRDGNPIGQIYDVFGQIKKPFYSIRFNSNQDIVDAGLEVKKVVYCAPKTEHTKFIFTNQLLKEKGSDASWVGNEEPPPSCLDYSDDEQEKAAKKKLNNQKKDDDDDDDVVLVKVEQADSPARKRYLSYEEQMNRNNTLRTKAYKRAASTTDKAWDGGWHNYKRNSGASATPEWNRDFSLARAGSVFQTPGNSQWQQNQPRSQPLFQFGGNASFQVPPFQNNFGRFRPPSSLGPPPQAFSGPPVPNFHPSNQNYGQNPQNFQPNASQSYMSQPVFRNPPPMRPSQFTPYQQNFQPVNAPQNFHTFQHECPVVHNSPPHGYQSPPHGYQSPPQNYAGQNCKCFQSNHRPPPVANQQRFPARVPFIPGFVSSPPPPSMQYRPNSPYSNVMSPPPPFTSFPSAQPYPVMQFVPNTPSYRSTNFRAGPPPPPGT